MRAADPIRRIDVSQVDGVWGWEGYTDPSGAGDPEDSQDIELDREEDPGHPSDVALLLGVQLELSNPLGAGTTCAIYRGGQEAARYRWAGPSRDVLASAWQLLEDGISAF